MHATPLSEQIILRILQEGQKTFESVLQLSHSMFPDELPKLLTTMEIKGVIYHEGDEYSINSSLVKRWRGIVENWQENLNLAHEALRRVSANIHLPHALDYEWWFMDSSREQLARKMILENFLPLPRSVVFLGSPLLGAFISIMLPDELEALKARNIPVQNWRYADLAVFASTGQILPENTYYSLEKYEWKEILVKKVKVKVKVKRSESTNQYISPSILSVHGANAVIQSVSRRDPFRETIDLWTSTHVGLQIQGWRTMLRIVEGIARGSELEQIALLIQLDNQEDSDVTIEKIKLDVEPVWQKLVSILQQTILGA